MRKIRLSMAIVLMLSFGTGCGTLRQPVSFSGLSEDAMIFIDEQPRSSETYTLYVGWDWFTSAQFANYVVPAIPFLYWKALAKEYDDQYYLMRHFSVLPILGSTKFGVFDMYGKPAELHSIYALSALIDLLTFETHTKDLQSAHPETTFAVRVLHGLLGFGSDYFQLLWIPIISPKEKFVGCCCIGPIPGGQRKTERRDVP